MGKKKLIIVKDDKNSTLQVKGKWKEPEVADCLLAGLVAVIDSIKKNEEAGAVIADAVIRAIEKEFKEFKAKEQTNE